MQLGYICRCTQWKTHTQQTEQTGTIVTHCNSPDAWIDELGGGALCGYLQSTQPITAYADVGE